MARPARRQNISESLILSTLAAVRPAGFLTAQTARSECQERLRRPRCSRPGSVALHSKAQCPLHLTLELVSATCWLAV